MGLRDSIISDAADYTSDTSSSGWAVPITITDVNGLVIVVNGLHDKHHMAVDDEGRSVSSKSASISVAEQNIIAANPLFIIRNSITKEVVMKGYKVSVTDSAGNFSNYKILQQFPDETAGVLTFTLSDYAGN
jgi:hypothetical protein